MIYRTFNFPKWRPRGAFGEFEDLRNQMNRFMSLFDDGQAARRVSGVFPLVNITEDKDRYYIRAELPGIKGEEIDVQVTANNISISGERVIEKEDNGVKYHRREREAGSFSRAITLPGDINSDGVEAGMINGILTIAVPKAEAAKPRQITVK